MTTMDKDGPLAQLLLQRGALAAEHAQSWMHAARQAGLPLGRYIADTGYIDRGALVACMRQCNGGAEDERGYAAVEDALLASEVINGGLAAQHVVEHYRADAFNRGVRLADNLAQTNTVHPEALGACLQSVAARNHICQMCFSSFDRAWLQSVGAQACPSCTEPWSQAAPAPTPGHGHAQPSQPAANPNANYPVDEAPTIVGSVAHLMPTSSELAEASGGAPAVAQDHAQLAGVPVSAGAAQPDPFALTVADAADDVAAAKAAYGQDQAAAAAAAQAAQTGQASSAPAGFDPLAVTIEQDGPRAGAAAPMTDPWAKTMAEGAPEAAPSNLLDQTRPTGNLLAAAGVEPLPGAATVNLPAGSPGTEPGGQATMNIPAGGPGTDPGGVPALELAPLPPPAEVPGLELAPLPPPQPSGDAPEGTVNLAPGDFVMDDDDAAPEGTVNLAPGEFMMEDDGAPPAPAKKAAAKKVLGRKVLVKKVAAKKVIASKGVAGKKVSGRTKKISGRTAKAAMAGGPEPAAKSASGKTGRVSSRSIKGPKGRVSKRSVIQGEGLVDKDAGLKGYIPIVVMGLVAVAALIVLYALLRQNDHPTGVFELAQARVHKEKGELDAAKKLYVKSLEHLSKGSEEHGQATEEFTGVDLILNKGDLARDQNADAAAALVAFALKSKDADLQREALKAVAYARAPSVNADLKKIIAMKGVRDDVKEAAERAIVVAGGEEAVEKYGLAIARGTVDKKTYFGKLRSNKSAGAITALIDVLKLEQDPEMRADAAALLGDRSAKEALPAIIEILEADTWKCHGDKEEKNIPDKVRAACVTAGGEIDAVKAMPAIAKAMSTKADERPETVDAAIEALAAAGDEAVPIAEELLKAGDSLGATILVKIETETSAGAMARQISGGDWALRAAVIPQIVRAEFPKMSVLADSVRRVVGIAVGGNEALATSQIDALSSGARYFSFTEELKALAGLALHVEYEELKQYATGPDGVKKWVDLPPDFVDVEEGGGGGQVKVDVKNGKGGRIRIALWPIGSGSGVGFELQPGAPPDTASIPPGRYTVIVDQKDAGSDFLEVGEVTLSAGNTAKIHLIGF